MLKLNTSLQKTILVIEDEAALRCPNPRCPGRVKAGVFYFTRRTAMDMPSALTDADLQAPTAVLVSSNLVPRLWPNGDPLEGGVHPAPRSGPPWYPVLGIAGAVRGMGENVGAIAGAVIGSNVADGDDRTEDLRKQ